MACKQLGDEGLELWFEWSLGAAEWTRTMKDGRSFSAERACRDLCESQWASFASGGVDPDSIEAYIPQLRQKVSLGSLFRAAQRNGFEFDPRPAPEWKVKCRGARIASTARADDPVVGDPEADVPRPVIEVTVERLEVCDQAVAALRRDAGLYVQDHRLCQVTTDVEGAPLATPIAEPNVGAGLSSVAGFVRTVAQGEQVFQKAIAVPDWLTRMVATLGDWPGVPVLRGIRTVPFPRPDGTIVEIPGFDPATGILLCPTVECRPIPALPTRDEAQVAAARLLEWLADFPFRDELDQVAALAGFLTPIARPMIVGPVPGFAVSSNKPGVGKGKLVDLMTMAVLGRPCPTSLYPTDDAEAAKLVTSLVREQVPVYHWDNLRESKPYGGGPVDSALTARSGSNRILGSNAIVTGPLRTVFSVAGNNITPGADAFRRWIMIELLTAEEYPERRPRNQFRRPELVDDAVARRGDLVHDLLLILRAHAVAGHPQPDLPGVGSYEHWDRIVRAAIHFATGRDCLATQ